MGFLWQLREKLGEGRGAFQARAGRAGGRGGVGRGGEGQLMGVLSKLEGVFTSGGGKGE